MSFEYRKFDGKNKRVEMPKIEDLPEPTLNDKKNVMMKRLDMHSYMESQRRD